MTTYRFGINGVDRQEFRKYLKNELWCRYVADGTWTAWAKQALSSEIVYFTGAPNGYTAAQLISAYPTGTTIFRVNASGAAGFPSDLPGMVTTYKFGINGIDRQEFRPISTNDLWRRYTDDSGNWTPWVNTGMTLAATAPATGTWVRGDKIYNSSPSAGGYEGWICVSSGIACKHIWLASTPYVINSRRFYGNNVYQATVAGTTSDTPPTHTNGTAVDGTVTWTYLGEKAVFKGFGLIEA
ncbi:MAG: hypothetical protein BWX44_00012 [Spirochaetes bacterium ADurb.Bin001]|nr:MAG: hypothetical protein BWX44_00012 [Spirochaetes bacterium ADurb.Bin001]